MADKDKDVVLTREWLDKEIKSGELAQVHLLFGTEEYLKRFYRKKLVSLLSDEGDTMNFARFEGKSIDPAQIIDLAETMPFFKDRRVILIEDSGFFKKACDELADYLKDPSSTTYFIFVEKEVDKRNRMYKACQQIGTVTELSTVSEEMLVKWAAGLLMKKGKKVTRVTLERFFDQCGSNMDALEMEINKLIDYVGEREVVETADVEAICTVEPQDRVFEMVDAMSSGQQRKALELYYDLLARKVEPLKTMALIVRQFNLILQVKELGPKIGNQNTLARTVGLSPRVVGLYRDKARFYSREVLMEALEECASLSHDFKSGLIDDETMVEMIIIKYSSKEKRVS